MIVHSSQDPLKGVTLLFAFSSMVLRCSLTGYVTCRVLWTEICLTQNNVIICGNFCQKRYSRVKIIGLVLYMELCKRILPCIYFFEVKINYMNPPSLNASIFCSAFLSCFTIDSMISNSMNTFIVVFLYKIFVRV